MSILTIQRKVLEKNDEVAARNRELMGGMENAFTLDYATDRLTPRGIRPALSMRRLYFQSRAVPILHPALRFFLPPFKAFEKLVSMARSLAKS